MSTTYVPCEGIIKLKPRSVRSTKAIGSKDIQKPDPAAVVAKSETDHHIKAESLRRTNVKIENIERCIATDIGDEVDIRQRIAESQRIIDENERKKAELEQILLQQKESIKKDQDEMKKSKDQRRENHSVELGQLVEEQATSFEELKKSEVVYHAELTQKIQGYKLNGQLFWDKERVSLIP